MKILHRVLTVQPFQLTGDLSTPPQPIGLVVFCHGSGSSRFSPRNKAVARKLNESGMATLLFDLLNEAEEREDEQTRRLRFDIPMLASRVVQVSRVLANDPEVRDLPLAYFGASTGAAAALMASVEFPYRVKAIVSRGGRPDLAGAKLPLVTAPTLLIVGGRDTEVIRLNQAALRHLGSRSRLQVVPGASHLFEEPGTLDQVTRLAASWFESHFRGETEIEPDLEGGHRHRPVSEPVL